MKARTIILFIALSLTLGVTSAHAQSDDSLFFVFLNTKPDRAVLEEAAVNDLQEGHLKNIEKLHAEGKLLAAGPLEGGGGIFILNAADLNTADSYLKTDPAIQAQRFNIEVFPMTLAIGSFGQIGELYSMETVQLVRLRSNNAFNGDWETLVAQSRTFFGQQSADEGNIRLLAYFSPYLDGVLLLGDSSAEEADLLMKQHPAVAAGMINYEITPLYIASETFEH